mmetsp:Transcript_3137/g.11241  ORF Transcript_3137/g.11241 Transcript_3137/m.11241 type:complete len:231 (+) Transcript_3137:1336-2028(+)
MARRDVAFRRPLTSAVALHLPGGAAHRAAASASTAAAAAAATTHGGRFALGRPVVAIAIAIPVPGFGIRRVIELLHRRQPAAATVAAMRVVALHGRARHVQRRSHEMQRRLLEHHPRTRRRGTTRVAAAGAARAHCRARLAAATAAVAVVAAVVVQHPARPARGGARVVDAGVAAGQFGRGDVGAARVEHAARLGLATAPRRLAARDGHERRLRGGRERRRRRHAGRAPT